MLLVRSSQVELVVDRVKSGGLAQPGELIIVVEKEEVRLKVDPLVSQHGAVVTGVPFAPEADKLDD